MYLGISYYNRTENSNTENKSVDSGVIGTDNYDELPTPTGYKRGSLVFYYLKVDDAIYTSTSEDLALPDDISKTEGSQIDINMLLQELSYQKIGTVQDVIDDIPVKSVQGHGFVQEDEIYRNNDDKDNYLYVVTETPKSAYYELPENKKVYHVIVMRIWNENGLEHRAK